VLDGSVRVIGTIDRKQGVDSVGLVGLRKPKGLEDRIVNIPWKRSYMRAGWTGAHTDVTSKPFVKQYISHHIVHHDSAPVLTNRAMSMDTVFLSVHEVGG
jgi:hypothetical protein